MGSIYKISLVCAVAAGILFSPTEAVSSTRSTIVKDSSGSLQDRPSAFKANDNSNSDIINRNYPFAIPVQLEDESDEYFDPFMEPFNDGRFESPGRFMPAESGIKFEDPINIDIYNGPVGESPVEESRIEESGIEESYIEQPCVEPPCNGESLGEDVFTEAETIEDVGEAEIEEETVPLEEIRGNSVINGAEDEAEVFEAEPSEDFSNDDGPSDSVEFSPDIEEFSDVENITPDIAEEFFTPHDNVTIEAASEWPALKTPELVRKICRSREFQPTTANYWTSETDKWLREFTLANTEEASFKDFGLFNFIAQKYLGCDGFYRGYQGQFPRLICDIRCEDVVAKVHNVHEARRVFFVLSSAAALGEKATIIHESIQHVPKHVIELVKSMPVKGWHDSPPEEVENILLETIKTTLITISPVLHKERTILEGRNALQVAKHYYDQACQVSHHAFKGDDDFRFDKIFNSEYEPSLTDLDFASKGHSEIGALIPGGMPSYSPLGRAVSRWGSVLEDARSFVVMLESGEVHTAMGESSEVFKRIFGADKHIQSSRKSEAAIEKLLTTTAYEAKEKLTQSFLDVLRGASNTYHTLGATDISIILRPGHHLPSLNKKSITEFQQASIERKVAREAFMKLFNNSLRLDPVYISCTRDIQSKSCSSDRSGPQDLKFCAPGGYVCYMYQWKDRPTRNYSRNTRPNGHENWNEKPWNIDVQHIIQSSFNNHMKKPCQEPTLATLGEPKHTSHFKIPVCVSDYNWNTPIDAGLTCNTDINCHAKNLPCHCGAWGKDTMSVWKDIGLTESIHHHYHSATVCPRQIRRRIHDDLERYVAFCKLDIRRGSSKSRVDGHRRFQGGDRYCDVIVNYIESMPEDPVTHETPRSRDLDKIDPSVKYAFLCHIRKGGRGCQMYKKTFDDLWNSWQESNPTI
ncbi:hypothetical protein DFP73DRAFT_635349 [Morchella snyderi]|nr:hypothetical protein DFP73DRAFT_635349 [Morchella snyderi]